MQLFAAKPPLDEDFSEDDLLSSACSSRRGSTSSMDYLQTSLTSLPIPADRGEREATSKAFRRRSSTSDALRFREKLQELSRSADMHDDMMGESPREHELAAEQQQDSASPDRDEYDNTVATTEAGNSNSNNNSPVDRVSLKDTDGDRGGSRPSNLFNVQFRSHIRASSDTSMLTAYTKSVATSKLTEVYATAKDAANPTTPRTERGMESDVISHVENCGTVQSSEERPISAPRLELLTIRGKGGETDSDRKSAIVDIGYDL